MTSAEVAAGLIPLAMLIYCAICLIAIRCIDGGLFRGNDGR